MGNIYRSGSMKKSNEGTKLTVTTILGVIFGFFVGLSFQNFSSIRLQVIPDLSSTIEMAFIEDRRSYGTDFPASSKPRVNRTRSHQSDDPFKIYVESNPYGAELLPPGIVVAETDLYLRRLWGDPKQDLKTHPKYLVTFTAAFDQSKNVDMAVKKLSDDFTILLFHYDGRASDWEQFEWSKHAIHVSIKKQTKWWYAKRFLHPDVVAAYDYIFVWDDHIGIEHFNADKYLHLVKKYGLEISQPGIDPNEGLTWEMTKRRIHSDVHKETMEKPGWCTDPHLPPCAAFVEIVAPVFSRNAWRCVWHMIQNDLVHGWGLDFAFARCVEPAHEKIGVVDAQWISYQSGSIRDQRQVRERSMLEWSLFQARLAHADRAYVDPTVSG
ncbi:uncharacterized protein LOC122042350 isoform X1 [Zingiber officinale]|uniref:uncharacterized protein LOC122042350 isoform X1 n=1 Tax=Zingiber officinale TaxID=94328 RepID=UPI001C4AD7FD|nr:uncharacterized protein LOC122042350 isoform X1 [Zingiber officinale]XP_042458342.1 uncharacterized protein LOC122042350 isoform X1 [Zingiber officinale]XP_042458343.1 uncharacterized protein LOC122042350 isoform X1 [Zingiber officinale]